MEDVLYVLMQIVMRVRRTA